MTAPSSRPKADDPRYLRTRRALIDAVISLVDADPAQPISITKLVETAGLTRPTFYQHFTDVNDALQQASLARINEIFPVQKPPTCLADVEMAVISHTLPALSHLHQHRSFYLRVIETAATAGFFEELVRLVRQRMLTEAIDGDTSPSAALFADFVDAVAGGSMWLVVRWLRGEISGTPEDIAKRVSSIAQLLHRTYTLAPEDA